MEVLDDPDRSIACSDFVLLELLPKAAYHKNETEIAFYEVFFDEVTIWAITGRALTEAAQELGSQAGTSALDSLHIAAAVAVGAVELVTTETSEKPIQRTKSIAVRTINPAVQPA